MTAYLSDSDIEAAKNRLRPILTLDLRRHFFGGERLARLERIIGSAIDSEYLLDLIVRQEGPQLIGARRRRIGNRNTSIRRVLLENLPGDRFRQLAKDLRPELPSEDRPRAEIELADFAWRRGGSSAIKMIRAFELPDSFAGIREAGKREAAYVLDPLSNVPPLKPFQRGILRELNSVFQRKRRVMVSSFTGTGKTRMGMEFVIQTLQADDDRNVVLWIAQKAELLEQACDAIDQLWPWLAMSCGNSLQVFRYWEGQSFEDVIPDQPTLIVATAQQVIARIGTGDPFLRSALSRARLLVIDEAHHALAKGHRTIIEHYEAARSDKRSWVLGLTATPGRSNLMDPAETTKLAELFGHTLVIPKVSSEEGALAWFQEQGFLSHLRHLKVRTDSQIAQTLGKLKKGVAEDQAGYRDYTQDFLEVVGEDSTRNKTILKELGRLSNEGRRSLVFCCNIPQAEMLFQTLIVQGGHAGLIHHKIDPRDRRHTINQFRRGEIQTLFNVEVLTTGFDAPKVDTIVMCRPTLSRILYEQMVGRGMRGPGMGGTPWCEVVDFTSNFGRFEEPQAWEAFWDEWRKPDTGAVLPEHWPGWEIIRAEPEAGAGSAYPMGSSTGLFPGDGSRPAPLETA